MRLKLVILILLIAGLIYYSRHHKKTAITSKSHQVLGSQTGSVNGVKNMIVDTTQNVLDTASTFVDNQVSQATTKVSDYVFSVASQNVVKQIDKLPESQKEEIKKTLCK